MTDRKRIVKKAMVKTRKSADLKDLEDAVESLYDDYCGNSELTDFTLLDGELFVKSSIN